MILTTTNNIDGYKIIEYKGIVDADDYDGKILHNDNSIKRALKNLEKKASEIGCDAVVGIAFVSKNGSSSGLDVQVYGTGVKIERIVK